MSEAESYGELVGLMEMAGMTELSGMDRDWDLQTMFCRDWSEEARRRVKRFEEDKEGRDPGLKKYGCHWCGQPASRRCQCGQVYYCSVEHQREDYPKHREVCRSCRMHVPEKLLTLEGEPKWSDMPASADIFIQEVAKNELFYVVADSADMKPPVRCDRCFRLRHMKGLRKHGTVLIAVLRLFDRKGAFQGCSIAGIYVDPAPAPKVMDPDVYEHSDDENHPDRLAKLIPVQVHYRRPPLPLGHALNLAGSILADLEPPHDFEARDFLPDPPPPDHPF